MDRTFVRSVALIHYTMSSIRNLADHVGSLTWREEVVGHTGRVLEQRTGSGTSLDAQRAWYLCLERCRRDPEAYACRLVLLDSG